MNLKKLIGLAAFACAFCAHADTLYVDVNDPEAGDDPAEGRGSEELPYASVQAAVTAAEADDSGYDFSAGDKILVKPGVYTNGTPQYVDSILLYANIILKKPVRIESTGGKDATVLEGRLSKNWREGKSGAVPWGTGSSRCVMVKADAEGSILKGFTFRNGGTAADNSKNFGKGGGVLTEGNAYIVDSTFTNCFSATSGAALEGGTAIRCLFTVNKSNHWGYGTVTKANLWNCFIRESAAWYPSGNNHTMQDDVCVNCTIMSTGMLVPARCTFQNCLVGPAGSFVTKSDYPNDYTNSLKGAGSSEAACAQMSPFTGDNRIVAGSTADGAGDTSKMLTLFTVPDEFKATDYAGNAIDYAKATCELGAIQGTIAAPCGFCRDTGISLIVDGWYVPANSFFRPSVYPSQMAVKPASGNFVCLGPSKYVPMMDGACHILAPPYVPPHASATNSWWTAGNPLAYWVDGENGDDENGDGTEANPYKTIQKASGKIVSKAAVVYVKPGTYATGGVTSGGVLTRFYADMSGGASSRFVSTDGPEKTILVGATNETDECRVVASTGNSGYVTFQGFTITGGRTTGTHEGAAASTATLVDCVISNCTSETSVFNSTSLSRCRIVGNTAGGSMIGGSYSMNFCHVYGNTAKMVLTTPGNPTVLSCTFTGNVTPAGQPHLNYNVLFLNNSIVDANGCEFMIYGRDDMGENYLQNFTPYTGSWDSSANFITDVDPRLAGPATGDERLLADSPAWTTGSFDWAAHSKLASYTGAQGDVNGRLLRFNADGSMPMGCNQYDAAAYVDIPAPQFGGLAVTGADFGLTVLDPGGTLTVTVSKAAGARRQILGFVVRLPDGTETTHYFADEPTWTHTANSTATSVKVTAVYDTNWYVDATNGDDRNDGTSPETAKKTLADVVTNTLIAAGDTIHAAPGVYNEGRMMGTRHTITYSRVVLPAGVALVSTEGKDVTVIEGANAPDEVVAKAQKAKDGCGTNAMRCVYMNENCHLEGFTLRKGRGLDYWTGALGEEYSGAGVYVGSGRGTARVVDCYITDCRTGSGAGSCGAACYRCKFIDNARNAGNVANYSTLVNCLIAGTGTGNAIADGCTVYGSTIRCTSGYMSIQEASITCYNSVLIGGTRATAHYYGCVMASNATWGAWSDSTYYNPQNCENCIHTNIASLAWDADLKPTTVGSTLVDAGYNEYLPAEEDDTKCDVDGLPRTMNYRPDVGCYEWDTRPEMKEILGGRIGSVGWISSNAVVTAGDKVRLDGDDATLEMTKANDSPLATYVTFADGGTLTALVNGKVSATTAKNGLFQMGEYKDGDKVSLVYEGEGSVTFGRLISGKGLVIIFR